MAYELDQNQHIHLRPMANSSTISTSDINAAKLSCFHKTADFTRYRVI